MSVYYKIQESPQPAPNEKLRPQHARFIPKNTIRIDQLCKEISDVSTFTPGDVKGLLQTLSDRIVFHLKYGEDLDIEGLGHFTASLGCNQPQNGGRHTAVHVHFNTVKFRCSKKIKEKLQTMHFEVLPKEGHYSSFTEETRRNNILNYLNTRSVIQSSVCMAINNCSRYMAIKDLTTLLKEKKISRLGNKKSAVYTLL